MSSCPVDKEFYSLADLAERWGCKNGDLIHLGGQGRAQVCVNIYGMADGIRRVRQQVPNAEDFAEPGGEAEQGGDSETSWGARTTIEMPHGVFELACEDLRVLEAQRCWPYELYVATKFDIGSWWECEFDPPVLIELEHLCVLREEAERLEREVFSNKTKDLPITSETWRTKGVAACQKEEILDVLRGRGYEPTALPPRPAGKPWVYAEIFPLVVPKLMTEAALSKRWQELRDEGRIAEVNGESLRVSPKKGE